MLNVGDIVTIVWPDHTLTGATGKIIKIEAVPLHDFYDSSRDCRVSIELKDGRVCYWSVWRVNGNYGASQCPCLQKMSAKPENVARAVRRIDAQLARLDKSKEKDRSRIARLTEKRKFYAFT